MKIGNVIHSKRKSFSLIVDKEGELLVRAPNGATRRQVQEIVEAHRDWILKKQAEIIKRIKTCAHRASLRVRRSGFSGSFIRSQW
jgi:predicted metal-dependent hydrolase